MIPQDLVFEHPKAVYLVFFLIPLFFLLWILYLYRKRAAAYFSTASLVPRSLPVFIAKAAALGAIWVLLTVVLMGPKGNAHYLEEEVSGQAASQPQNGRRRAHQVILLLDASASMAVADTRTKVSRLDYAKEVADLVVSKLTGESVSLYTFTADLTQLSPQTFDYLFVRLMLRQIAINEGGAAGTDFYAALEGLRQSVFSRRSPDLKTLILFSDGGDGNVDSVSGDAKNEAIAKILNTLNGAEAEHLRVFTIGIGTLEGGAVPGVEGGGKSVVSGLEEDLLERIALRGRGRYFFANKESTPALVESLMVAMRQDPAVFQPGELTTAWASQAGDKVYDYYFQLPLGIAVLLLAFVLLFPEASNGKE